MIALETEPSNAPATAPRPLDPTTIKWAFRARARSTAWSGGCPSRTSSSASHSSWRASRCARSRASRA